MSATNTSPSRPWNPISIVTGAASGIGLATVRLLAARGGRVVAVDLTPASLTAFDPFPEVVTHAGDVTDESVNTAAVELAERTWGRLDVLVLNAGVRGSGPIETVDMGVFDRSIDVNLRAVALGMRAGIPALRRSGGGSIVVTSSNTGLFGEENRWPYAAAKAGAINLVRSVALDVGPDQIRVNAVCPGPTITGMTEHLIAGQPERFAALSHNVPLRRWATAEEIAEAIVWLASPSASFVTGVALPVDGGATAGTGQPPASASES
jgi:meso-butanediol dehydrogenase/(S,S)-butanediol dehydrogenase/diacetyl reductase